MKKERKKESMNGIIALLNSHKGDYRNLILRSEEDC